MKHLRSTLVTVLIVLLVTLMVVIVNNCDNNMPVYIYEGSLPGPKVCFIGSVHGNEPAGGNALQNMINDGTFDNVQRGTVKVIPSPNPVGVMLNMRWQPLKLTNRDLNRNFIDGGLDDKSRRILKEVEEYDIVIDIHEGWGFNKLEPTSLGSTLSPSNTKVAVILANMMIDSVNTSIDEEYKKYGILPDRSCELRGTLACNSQTNGRSHVLIEITGQRNRQPLSLREMHAQVFITKVLEELSF